MFILLDRYAIDQIIMQITFFPDSLSPLTLSLWFPECLAPIWPPYWMGAIFQYGECAEFLNALIFNFYIMATCAPFLNIT